METIMITKIKTVVRFYSEEKAWEHPVQDGNEFAIAYQLDGCARHRYAGGDFVMQKDTIMVFGSRDWYTVEVDTPGTCIAIHFMTEDPLPFPLLHIHGDTALPFKSDFQRLYTNYNRRDISSWCDTMSGLYGVLAKVQRMQEKNYVQRQKYKNIQAAKEYLHIHFQESDLGVSKAAEIAGISVRRFGELFATLYGATPGRYITALRMQTAREMLLTHSYSVTETARAVGYRDVGYFCRAFTQETGVSPGQYAKSAKL